MICLNSFGAEIKTDKNYSKIEKQEFPKTLNDNSKSITFHFTGTIDGSDEILITNEKAIWKHKHWGWPTNVKINGISWNPQQTPFLLNRGKTKYLKNNVDFSHIRILYKSGRDSVIAVPGKNSIKIYFADNPIGAGIYKLNLAF
ncbi:MAG: hypothetical protein PHV82_02580 [Victivallaceae bacterium]|nr:hypothetical protein [Victivallaceae bacterium]